MEEPMVLVYNTDGKLQVNPEALSLLRSVQDQLVVVAVASAYRTVKSYLLNCLTGVKKDENSEQNREYNNLRRGIRDHFPTRRCFAFPCPAPRKKLKGLQEMDEEDLDEDIVKELQRVRDYVHTHKKVKRVLGGHQVTGRRFAEVTETYVGTMEDRGIPCVERSVTRMMEVENKAALDEALGFYRQNLSQFSHRGPEPFSKLFEYCNENHKEAMKIFMKKSMSDTSEKHILELEEAISSHYNSLTGRIEAESRERCETFLSEAMGSIQEKLDSGHFHAAGGYQELDSELSEAVKKYKAATKDEVQGNDVLAHFLDEKKPLLDRVQKVDRKLTEEQKHGKKKKHWLQCSAVEKELSRVKEEMEKREREWKAAEERRKKELLEQLREKFEEAKRFSLEELKSAMEKIKREVEKYSTEGWKEDAERAQETYEYLKQKYAKEKNRSFITKLIDAVPDILTWAAGGAAVGMNVGMVRGAPGRIVGGVVDGLVGGVAFGIGYLIRN